MKHLFHLIRWVAFLAGVVLTCWLGFTWLKQRSGVEVPPDPATDSGLAAIWRGHLEDARLLDNEEKFNLLMPGLERLKSRIKTRYLWSGFRADPPTAVEIAARRELEDVFAGIQREVLATPGHARHCAKVLEAGIPRMDPAGGTLTEGQRERCLVHYWSVFADPLRNLPSPETVMVVGGYLYDGRDEPPATVLESDELLGVPPMSLSAAFLLASMQLREFPFGPGDEWITWRMAAEMRAKARVWFDQVRTGKRAFSFKGQAVEYRFKPDGTWTTTPIANPPDDGPKLRHPIPATVSDPSLPWPLLVGYLLTACVVTILAVAAYRLRSRMPPAAWGGG